MGTFADDTVILFIAMIYSYPFIAMILLGSPYEQCNSA
jgi:hypothetical protein